MRSPINETYSPFTPSRREQRRQRIAWLIAAGLVSAMMWFVAVCLFHIGYEVGLSVGETYERVVSAVGGR